MGEWSIGWQSSVCVCVGLAPARPRPVGPRDSQAPACARPAAHPDRQFAPLARTSRNTTTPANPTASTCPPPNFAAAYIRLRERINTTPPISLSLSSSKPGLAPTRLATLVYALPHPRSHSPCPRRPGSASVPRPCRSATLPPSATRSCERTASGRTPWPSCHRSRSRSRSRSRPRPRRGSSRTGQRHSDSYRRSPRPEPCPVLVKAQEGLAHGDQVVLGGVEEGPPGDGRERERDGWGGEPGGKVDGREGERRLGVQRGRGRLKPVGAEE